MEKTPQDNVPKNVEDDIKDQVDDFLDDLLTVGDGTGDVAENVEEGTKEDVHESEEDKAAVTDKEDVEEPVEKVDEPSVEKPVEEKKVVEEVDDLDEMRKQMNEMAKSQLGVTEKVEKEDVESGKEKVVEKPVEKVEKEEVEKEPPAVDDIRINEDEFGRAIESVDGFNAVLEKVNKIVESRNQQFNHTIIKALPKVINGVVEEIVDLRMAASDFYRMNEDLIPFKPLCSVVANELSAKNPGKEPDELFSMVGEEVRKRLKLNKSARNSAKTKKRSPAVVNEKSAREPEPPELTGMQAEIDEILTY